MSFEQRPKRDWWQVALWALLIALFIMGAGSMFAGPARGADLPGAPDGEGWHVPAPEECAGIAAASWWAKEAFSKTGMSGPLKVTAAPDRTAWTRDGAWFVFEVEWRPGQDCVARWRTRAKESF